VHHLRASESHPAWVTPLYRRVERAYLRSCDAFVFNSATTRDSVVALSGRAAPHVIAYPGGDRFGAPPVVDRQNDGVLRLIFVGNVTARKGLHTLIDALAQARCAWTLDVVGSESVEPGYASRMRARAQRLGLAGRLRWHGRLDDTQLAGLYAGADALAVPSQYEGFGIVYLEAMGFGVPVIASSAGAAREIVTDGKDGFLVPPENAEALAAAIERLADPARLADMRAAARARFARHPGWDSACARIREFLVTLTTGS
jgi:glycosyltransferase involved in cell wall biosynthesis